MRSMCLGVAGIVVVLAMAPARSAAQSTPARGPEFEVASVRGIKQTGPLGGVGCAIQSKPVNLSLRIKGNGFTMNFTTLGGLIMDAYNVRGDQFSGLPGWAGCKDQYEIKATTPGEEAAAPEQIRLMLQTLLADRFQLKLHHETRKLTVYEMTVAKNGLKVKVTPERTTGSGIDQWGMIPLLIENFLDYPIVDKTGLTGFIPGDAPKWDDAQLWEEMKQGRPAPSIFHEVESEFGLTLKKVSEPADFLVIEDVKRPSEN